MKAEIITIGDEILIGQIVDTNSAWMGVELNQLGIQVAQITSISDTPEHLIEAITAAKQRADIVLITGGLGPTKDDRTKKVLTEYFNSKLITHEPTLEHIRDFFYRRGSEVSQLNKDQALVPECCEVIMNPVGTAPGMWFEQDNTVFVSMPGVPFEMKEIMSKQLLPRFAKMTGRGSIVHRTVLTTGIGESLLAETIEQWEDALPDYINLAYLPSPGRVRLRMSAFGVNEETLNAELDKQVEALRMIIPEAIYGYNDDTLAGVVGQMLIERNATMASAESCTGGRIAHKITSVSGSSAWYKGSVVAYANETKVNVLKVDSEVIALNGAVSEEVVKQMADGVRNALHVDYAVATSGIAGPDGGTEEKPVGTVWIAVATPNKTVASLFKFANNRERNIIRSSQAALNMLRLEMLSE